MSSSILSEKLGITHGYIGCKTTLNHKIRDIVGPQSADVVIDTTGNEDE